MPRSIRRDRINASCSDDNLSDNGSCISGYSDHSGHSATSSRS